MCKRFADHISGCGIISIENTASWGLLSPLESWDVKQVRV
jgi:hypothetical protein